MFRIEPAVTYQNIFLVVLVDAVARERKLTK